MKPYYKYYELKAIEKGNWVLFDDLEHYFQIEKVFGLIKIKVYWVNFADDLQCWETTKLFKDIKDFNKWYMKSKIEWSFYNAR